MNYEKQDSDAQMINLISNYIKITMMDILETETNKLETIIDSNKIYQMVHLLDVIEAKDSIPEEFSIENFTHRFNIVHNENLIHSLIHQR